MWEEHQRRMAANASDPEEIMEVASTAGGTAGNGRVSTSVQKPSGRRRQRRPLFPTNSRMTTLPQPRPSTPSEASPSEALPSSAATAVTSVTTREGAAEAVFEPLVLRSTPGLRRAFLPKLHTVSSWRPRLCNLMLPKYLLALDADCTVQLYRQEQE